jgi:hypothetical protein
MVLKYWHPIFFAFLLSLLAGASGCEDNPDECVSNSDCPQGCRCKATYYYSGNRSGGYCEVPDGGLCVPQESGIDGAADNAGGASGTAGGSAGTETGGAGGQSQTDDAST